MSPGHVVVGVDTCLPNPSPVLYPHAHPPLCHTFLPAPLLFTCLFSPPSFIWMTTCQPGWLKHSSSVTVAPPSPSHWHDEREQRSSFHLPSSHDRSGSDGSSFPLPPCYCTHKPIPFSSLCHPIWQQPPVSLLIPSPTYLQYCCLCH